MLMNPLILTAPRFSNVPVFSKAMEVLSESESELDDEPQPPEPAAIPTFTTPSPFPYQTYEQYDPKVNISFSEGILGSYLA
jgi:hypothetical protein